MNKKTKEKPCHIVLTSHPHSGVRKSSKVDWGASTAKQRGPLIATTSDPSRRNVIGTHSGSYSLYRALAVASGSLDKEHRPDLQGTTPTLSVQANEAWFNPEKIVSLDPFGHLVTEAFQEEIAAGIDVRPTIAITKARLQLPEIEYALRERKIKADGKILNSKGEIAVHKIAIEPVWYLPGIAKRFKIEESFLRQELFQQTAGMFPELVTRSDFKVFLPPVGGSTIYIIGDFEAAMQNHAPVALRVHDECNGSDVFGSDICTCRPYLMHGLEVSVELAQKGGIGLIVYNRKEGRALGEVTKFLVYNARKRQAGGDTAEKYFERTECVAGVQDVRFQEFMPDILHWLGLRQIDELVSMSHLKYDSIVNSGIKVIKRIALPSERIPEDANIEISAKLKAGYYDDNHHKP